MGAGVGLGVGLGLGPTLACSAVRVRMTLTPQFWASVRGITSMASATALYGHCAAQPRRTEHRVANQDGTGHRSRTQLRCYYSNCTNTHAPIIQTRNLKLENQMLRPKAIGFWV